MADITASVGNNGKNLEPDVTEVQTLLNVVSAASGGPEPGIDIDGWCGKNTNKAILNFQKAQKLAVQDGRVDPGKATITRLNALVQGPNTRPVAPPDIDPATLARQSVPLASQWANKGLTAVRNALNRVTTTGSLTGLDSITLAALAGHFKIVPSLSKARLEQLLKVTIDNFSAALAVLAQSGTMFRSVSRKQMSIDFGGGEGAPGYVMPGNRTRVNWSPFFHVRRDRSQPLPRGLEWTGQGFGPKCRAAMVLHEPIHIVDSRGGHDLYEHGPQYASMTPDVAVHNAASYPSFGAHIDEQSPLPLGPRYGAGRPED